MANIFTPEQKDFLLYQTRTGKLATVRKDGSPNIVPIWFVLDEETIIFTTEKSSAKAANMRRDPRVTLCVDDERPPFAYIQVQGTVTLTENDRDLLHWATLIGGRYMGKERAEEYGKRNAVESELIVRLTPTRIIFQKDIAI